MDTELDYEQPNMAFLLTVFQKLSRTIKGSLTDEDIRGISNKQLEDIRGKRGTTGKTTDQQRLDIHVVLMRTVLRRPSSTQILDSLNDSLVNNVRPWKTWY